jgi:hypothetical protein
MAENTARLEIRLPMLLRAQVETQAALRGWSTAMYVREAVKSALHEEQAGYRRKPRQ